MVSPYWPYRIAGEAVFADFAAVPLSLRLGAPTGCRCKGLNAGLDCEARQQFGGWTLRCNKSDTSASSGMMRFKNVHRCCEPRLAIQSSIVRNLCVILMLIAALLPSRTFLFASDAAVEHTGKQQGEVGCRHCACGGDSTCCLKPATPDSKSPAQTPLRVQHFDSLAMLACPAVLVSRRDAPRCIQDGGDAESGKRRHVPIYLRNCSFLI